MTSPDVFAWLAGLSTRGKLLVFASTVFVIELGLRQFARKSAAYARWTGFFRFIGEIWTGVLLSLVYVFSVGLIGIGNRLFGRDLLDRGLAPEPTFWRTHEPNPLGPAAAVRHQF